MSTITKFLRPVCLWTAVALLGIASVGCNKAYEFNDITVGHDGAARAPKAKTNSQFVRSVYADLIGRAPETYDFVVTDESGAETSRFTVDELEALQSILDGVGDPDSMRSVLVAGLVGSKDVSLPAKSDVEPNAFVTEEFHRFLGRDPTTYELHAFVDAWKSSAAVGPKTVVRAILSSREYQSN